jgi:thiopeptide-type bacteriocin biosynthesis protein
MKLNQSPEHGNGLFFFPGQEWAYFKLYCGPVTADEILSGPVYCLSQGLIANGMCDKWFFVRFQDPHPHLRIRFHLTHSGHLQNVVELVGEKMDQYLGNGLVWKLQMDTYQREVNRYGWATMSLSEDLFFFDSQLICNLLTPIRGEDAEECRLNVALFSIDMLMADFGLNLTGKLELATSLRDCFYKEFGVNRDFKKLIDAKFRTRKRDIGCVIERSGYECSESWNEIMDFVDAWSVEQKKSTGRILRILCSLNLKAALNDLIASYIHMHCNRLFRSRQRMYELVLCDFLCRYYETVVARTRYDAGYRNVLIIR